MFKHRNRQQPATLEANGDAKHAGAHAVLLTIAGIALILASVLMGLRQEHADSANDQGAAAPIDHRGWEVATKFLEHFGVALIVVGVVGVLLERKDWEAYFQRQISRTILEKPFIHKLSPEDLRTLQIETTKAFFQIDDLDQKDSFLRHFQNQLHGYLGSPFREDVQCVIAVDRQSPDELILAETVSWTCRKVGDRIQDHVRWVYSTEEDFFTRVSHFEIDIKVPERVFKQADFKVRYPNVGSAQQRFGRDGHCVPKIEPSASARALLTNINDPPRTGFELILSDYAGIDGLLVTVRVKYHMPSAYMNFWTMTHLSKNVRIVIKFPEDQEIQVARFGLNQLGVRLVREPGVFVCSYDSWVLPETGLAFLLLPPAATQSLNAPSETVPEHVEGVGNDLPQLAADAVSASP